MCRFIQYIVLYASFCAPYIVWKLLSDNAHWEYDKLKHASGLSDRDLNAAIGWLAREDKIDFDIDEQHDRLFLHVNVYIG